MSGRVLVGTSGWVYKQWAGNFYPKGWPKKDEFGYYAQHFPTVEINATFYRLPTLAMVRGWRERSPEGFLFAVKGSRFLTHIKRLNDTGLGLRRYFSRIKPLGERTGPILWQLPPNFQKNEDNWQRLKTFLERIPKRYRHAIEFRHPSWMDEQTLDLLRTHGAANVWISSLRMPQDYSITSDFVYLRFHGLKDGAYHDYTDAELEPWAKQLARAAAAGIPAYVYFNNDLNTRAPLNAHSLMRMLGEQALPALTSAKAPLPDIAAPARGPETWPAWNRASPPAKRNVKRRRPAKAHSHPEEARPARPGRSTTTPAGRKRVTRSGRRRPATATTG
jgi:uncharacterized protein YecE (DUF72 family)